MATASTSSTSAHTGHPVHNWLAIKRFGFWLFLLSETFLFAALITSRYYLRGVETPHEVDQALGLGLTVILLVSSLTAYRAEVAASFGDQAKFRVNILLTIVMGLVFIGGVAYEWQQAFHHFPPDDPYGTILFTLTGVHGAHVFSGVVLLALALNLGRNGRWGPGNYWGVEATVKYWHFVDLAWVVIYPTLYLVR